MRGSDTCSVDVYMWRRLELHTTKWRAIYLRHDGVGRERVVDNEETKVACEEKMGQLLAKYDK